MKKEFQRLKEEENNRLKLDWNLQRTLAKVNYTIHTDAIKERLIPDKLSAKQTSFVYASEADLLNMALFGKTATAQMTSLVNNANLKKLNQRSTRLGLSPKS